MSDFQDLLGGLAGINQRGMMIRNQHAQLASQAEHARRMEAQAREMQESAKRTEDIERERLKIEKERIRLQLNQDELNKQRAQELREMRKFLTSMGGSLASLRKEFSTKKPRPCEEDMTLTIQLATLEAAASFIMERDMFEEIADMQIFAQFRADLDSLISESFNAGYAKKHPLEFVRTTIFHCSNEMDEMREYYSALFKPAEILKRKRLYAFTKSEINDVYSKAKKMLAGLAYDFGNFLKNLRLVDCPIDLNLYSDEIRALSKIPPSSPIPVSSPNSSYFALLSEHETFKRGIFTECAKGRGAKFKEITASLKWAISICESWPTAMQDALSILAEVEKEAEAGNYISAKRLYENCPRKVSGFDYKALEESILRWENQLKEAQKVYGIVKLGYSSKIKAAKGRARISLTRQCEEEFSPLISKLIAFQEDANSLPQCEYENDANKLLGEVNDTLRELRKKAAKIEARAKVAANILYSIIGALSVVLAIWLIILLLKSTAKPPANPTSDSATAAENTTEQPPAQPSLNPSGNQSPTTKAEKVVTSGPYLLPSETKPSLPKAEKVTKSSQGAPLSLPAETVKVRGRVSLPISDDLVIKQTLLALAYKKEDYDAALQKVITDENLNKPKGQTAIDMAIHRCNVLMGALPKPSSGCAVDNEGNFELVLPKSKRFVVLLFGKQRVNIINIASGADTGKSSSGFLPALWLQQLTPEKGCEVFFSLTNFDNEPVLFRADELGEPIGTLSKPL